MRPLLHTEFAALLARAGISQACFARLSGLTPRQVNNWCRGRAAVPPWAAILAAILDERSPDALDMMVDDAQFSWHETLGVPRGAASGEIDGAVRRLARRYAPDQGGTEAQRTRIDTAGAQARTTAENRPPAQAPPLTILASRSSTFTVAPADQRRTWRHGVPSVGRPLSDAPQSAAATPAPGRPRTRD